MLLTCVALGWLATAQAGDPKPIAVTVGEEFKITLQYNVATGYQWQLAKPVDEKLVKLLGSEYKRPDSKEVGGSGDMEWTFQALAGGKAKMEFNYVRPWERGEKPARTTNFVVTIKGRKKAENKP